MRPSASFTSIVVVAALLPCCFVDIPEVSRDTTTRFEAGSGGAQDDPVGDGDGDGDGMPMTMVGPGGAASGNGGTPPVGSGGAVPSTGGGTGEPVDYPDNLVDDFEDGDEFIVGEEGRIGFWNSDVEPGATLSQEGVIVPTRLEAPRGDSEWALHLSGSGFAGPGAAEEFWGAEFGTELNRSGDTLEVYDLSKYTGVRFDVMGAAPLVLQVRTRQTLPAERGGSGECEPGCYDHYHASFPVTSTWTTIEVPFTSLGQYGFGTATTLNLEQALAVFFHTQDETSVGFDVWVDNVEFY